MAKNRKVEVEYSLVNGSFNKGIKETSNQINTLNKEFKLQKEQMRDTASDTEKFEAQLAKLNKEYELAQEKTRQTEVAFENMKEMFGESSEAARVWGDKLLDAQKNQAYLENQVRETTVAIDKAKQAQTDYANEMDKVSRSTKELETLFEATGRELSEFSDILGVRLVQDIKRGEASSDQLDIAINRVAKSAIGAEVDIGQLRTELRRVDEGSASVQDVRLEISRLSDEANEAEQHIESMSDKLAGSALMQGAEALSGIADGIRDIGLGLAEGSGQLDELTHKYLLNFGLMGDETDGVRERMTNLFTSGFVDSFEQANAIMISTREQLQDLNDEDLGRIETKVSAFANRFDADIPETLRGVNALMKSFGMTADEALDLMVVGTQNGLDKTNELGDNLAEYATLFADSGYSAEEMFTILETGLDAGAYNLDRVNDLVKEFGVRISDGAIEKAIDEIGGSFETTFETMRDSGASNQEIFQALTKELNNVTDEQERATIASAIFGTQGEDNGLKVLQAMGNLNGTLDTTRQNYEDVANASEGMMELSAYEAFQQAWREIQQAIAPVGDVLLSLGADLLPPIADFITNIVTWISEADPWVQKLIEYSGLFLGVLTALVPLILGLSAVMLVLNTSMLPIIGVVALISAVIIGVIAVFREWEGVVQWFKDSWANMTSSVSSWAENLRTNISSMWESIKNATVNQFNTIRDSITEKINQARDAVGSAIDAVKNFFNFEFKWPKIPMPHFSVSPPGWQMGDLLKGSIPRLGVEWYAQGGIMRNPSIFGMNGNNLMVGGEAGAEAILPLTDNVLGKIGDSIVSATDLLTRHRETEARQNIIINIDDIQLSVASKNMARLLIDDIEFEREMKIKQDNRRKGKKI